MHATAASCAIKGTAFDYLTDAIERTGYTGKKGNRSEEKVLPLCSRQMPECSRPGDLPSALRRLLVPSSLLSSALYRQL